MIYVTAYDTSVGKLIDTHALRQTLEEAMVRELTHTRTLSVTTRYPTKAAFVLGVGLAESQVPYFPHPYLLRQKALNVLFTDLRVYLRRSEPEVLTGAKRLTDLPVKNLPQAQCAYSRAILNLAWMEDGRSRMELEFRWARLVYAQWLGHVITKRYALDAREQAICVLAAFYFYTLLHKDVDVLEGDALDLFVLDATKALRYPASFILEFMAQKPQMASASDLCKVISTFSADVRLQELNFPTLLTIIANSWYGIYAKEWLSVSLEHPPSWCAMVYAALVDRTYKHAIISQIAERYGKQGQADGYAKAYAAFIEDYLMTSSS